MKTLLYLAIMVAYISASGQQKINSVYFENDEYQLDAADKVVINEFASFVIAQQHFVNSIEVIGYTDTFATQSYNVALSQKRALSVKHELDKLLADSLLKMVNINWHGEVRPSQSESGYHYTERCADMIVHYTIKEELITEVDKISDLFDSMQKDVQTYFINPKNDTILEGNEGTIISISENAFYIPSNLKDKPVEIILVEYYDYASMILNGLTTMAGSAQLETGGMIYLNAKIGNRMLTISDEYSISIMFPGDELKEDMQLFEGKRDKNNNIDWKPTRNPMSRFTNTQITYLLTPASFKNKRYRKNCPYWFCGVREDLNIDNRKYIEKRAYYLTDWKAYNKYKDSICAVYGVSDFRKLNQILRTRAYNQTKANYYVTNATGLGFMNCDRYLNGPIEDRVIVSVDATPADNTTAYLVFNSFKSILPVNYLKPNVYQFDNIEKGAECSVVVIKYENKVPYLSITPITTSENRVIKPEYVKMNAAELRNELAKLN